MQVNFGSTGLRVLNDQPFSGPANTLKRSIESNARQSLVDVGSPQLQGPPTRVPASFGSLLPRVDGPLPPTPNPSPLGVPDQPGQLESQVRDYRQTLNAVHADLVSQLKSAQDTLKQARQSGDQDAITAAQKAIDDLNVQLKANHDSLSAVHNDVKGLREMRQQLIADVKAGNLDAIQQDRNAISQQRDVVLADIQA